MAPPLVSIAPLEPWQVQAIPTTPSAVAPTATATTPWWQQWYVVFPVLFGVGFLVWRHRKKARAAQTTSLTVTNKGSGT